MGVAPRQMMNKEEGETCPGLEVLRGATGVGVAHWQEELRGVSRWSSNT